LTGSSDGDIRANSARGSDASKRLVGREREANGAMMVRRGTWILRF